MNFHIAEGWLNVISKDLIALHSGCRSKNSLKPLNRFEIAERNTNRWSCQRFRFLFMGSSFRTLPPFYFSSAKLSSQRFQFFKHQFTKCGYKKKSAKLYGNSRRLGFHFSVNFQSTAISWNLPSSLQSKVFSAGLAKSDSWHHDWVAFPSNDGNYRNPAINLGKMHHLSRFLSQRTSLQVSRGEYWSIPV